MKFCRHCGAEMQEGAKVCLKCGITDTTAVKKEIAYCSHCGAEMNSQASVCVKCGYQQKSSNDDEGGKIKRTRKGKILAGVCSGIAKAKGINVWLIRIAFFLFNFLIVGIGTIGYIVAAIALPKEDEE